jgi:PAS domain S-box-containing protein
MNEMADALPLITIIIRGKELFVVGERQLRFYVSIPVDSADGTILGVLAVMDYVLLTLTKMQIEALQPFAVHVTLQFELCQRRPLTEGGGASPARTSAILVDRQQSWQDNEELFHLMVDSVNDYGIYMLDIHGHARSWNAGAERFKGFKGEEIIGKHFSTFYSKGDLEQGKPAAGFQAAIAKGRFDDEGWRVRKDRSEFWANVVITALRGGIGQLRGIFKVTRDIVDAGKQLGTFWAVLNEPPPDSLHRLASAAH